MKYYKLILLSILSLTVFFFNVSAQRREGDIERKAGNYEKAIGYYLKEDLSSSIALRLAKCYAMIDQPDYVFYYLNIFVEREKENLPVTSLEDIEEFEKFREHVEWEKLINKCIQFHEAFEAKLNIPLRDSIIEMRRIDNYYQEKFDSIMLTNDSVLIQSFKEEWNAAVKENDLKLAKIIDTYGWPTKELVGNNASGEVFFLAQHSLDVELQKKCLKKLKQVFNNNVNDLIQIAYLEDRILVTTGQKQLYGTQYKKGKLYPVDDPDNLNRRRAQIGLAPVQFIPTVTYAKNLIPNYGFELYSGNEFPKFLIQIDGGWKMAAGESFSYLTNESRTSHSGNFIHICKDQSYFNSYTGNAYVRYSNKYQDYVTPQLFQVELKDSLFKGDEYLIEYYIRIQSRSKFATTHKNDVCIFFSRYKYNYKITSISKDKVTFKEDFKMTPDIYFYENRPIEDFSEWTKVSNKYVAKGWEKYFLIGSYGYIKFDCSISIDNITLRKIPKTNINIENTNVGDAIILENISFELNSSKLTESSYPTLSQLVELFHTYPNLILEIAGHTDNTGNKDANLKLSENRAKSVVSYLISEGVESKRVHAKGYGESFPISDNKTEQGREENRRVEFKILQR